jgi:predicted PurR-regulated permease PerM
MEEETQEVNPNPPSPASPALPANISPRWKTSSKRLVLTTLLVLALLAVYAIRSLLIPIIMAMVLGYVVLPVIEFLHRQTRLSRGMAIGLIYLVIIAILIAIPISTIPQLINQGNNLINNIPGYVIDIGTFLRKPLIIGDYTIPLDELPLEQVYDVLSRNIIDIIQTIGRQCFNIFGSVDSRTISTVLSINILLFLSFYMLKDYRERVNSTVAQATNFYNDDLHLIGRENSATCNAF